GRQHLPRQGHLLPEPLRRTGSRGTACGARATPRSASGSGRVLPKPRGAPGCAASPQPEAREVASRDHRSGRNTMKRIALALAIMTCTVVATEALAQSDIGFKRVGAAVGFVSPEDLDGIFTFGVFANLGNVTPKIELEPRLDFWSWSDESFGAKTSVRDITL